MASVNKGEQGGRLQSSKREGNRKRQRNLRERKAKEKQMEVLHSKGFIVLEAPVASEELVNFLRGQVDEWGVFIKSFTDARKSDRARRMVTIEEVEQGCPLWDFIVEVEKNLPSLLGGTIQPNKVEVLQTVLPLQQPQLLHTDHGENVEVYSVIIALNRPFTLLSSEGGWKSIKEGRELSEGEKVNLDLFSITVKVGQMVLFRGDWPHAGATDHTNVRLFLTVGKFGAFHTQSNVNNISRLNAEAVWRGR